MPKTQPTIEQFKRFSKDIAPAARAVLMARVYAEMERERVDAYIRPIFDRYGFTYSGKYGKAGPIEKQDHLYLCDDEPGIAAYFAECDTAHRAHGFKGPDGHCPALTAEHLVVVAENALIGLAEPMFGVAVSDLYGDRRAKYLDLLIGAAVEAAA